MTRSTCIQYEYYLVALHVGSQIIDAFQSATTGTGAKSTGGRS